MNKTIMIVGNYKWNIYEEALSYGFKQNNILVIDYIIKSWSLSYKILHFKKLNQINVRFINEVLLKKPNAIFLYRTNELFSKTLQKIKKSLPDIKIVVFHNDNPYNSFKNRLKYFLFLKSLPIADIVYAYRPINLVDAKNNGAKNSRLLYPHFYSKNDLIKDIDFTQKKYDVVFIGHYEENRAVSMNFLIQKGIDVKIFGSKSAWKIAKEKYNWSDNTINNPVYKKEYKKTLSQARLALCFLSKINNDVYTRRNFEIPATGTLTVSEYTKELTEIFEEDEEILLFKNDEELYEKISSILKSKKELESKTIASYNKITNGGHSEISRAKQIIENLGWIS